MQHDMGDNINGAEALQSNTGVTSSGAEDTEGVVGVKEHRVGIGQSVRGERTVQAGVQCSMTAKGDNEVVNNQPGSDAVIEVLADIEVGLVTSLYCIFLLCVQCTTLVGCCAVLECFAVLCWAALCWTC